MATRRPLVLNNGLVSELLDGDTVTTGISTTQVIAGSGLTGGGSVSNNTQIDLALAPNPSGIIYVGDALGIDGAAQVIANSALVSGSTAAFLASNALASGNNSLVVAPAALASGNAALALIPTLGGGEGGTTTQLTAASAIASGYAVGVDDAGRVQSVRSVAISGPSFSSPAVVFEPARSDYITSVYDSANNRIVVAYSDIGNSNYGTAIVGTISGSTVSFGTPVVFDSVNTKWTSASYDSTNNRVVIAYLEFTIAGYGRAVVGTVSGTSISFGTPVVFHSNITEYIATTFNTTGSKIVIAYSIQVVSGNAIVGTVSGTSISFGTTAVFNVSRSEDISICYDSSNNKSVIAYRNIGNSNYGTAVVATVSGTSISYGTPVVFQSATTNYNVAVYASTQNRVVILYRNSDSNYGASIVGTISGTSISFGTPVIFTSATSLYLSGLFDVTNSKIVCSFWNADISRGQTVLGSVSGTSISFGSPQVFELDSVFYISSAYNSSSSKFLIAYSDVGNSRYGTAIVGDSSDSLSYSPTINSYPNVLGISQSTVASGSSCLVNLPGTLYNNPAANYTVGAFYYANPTTSGVTITSTKPTLWDGQVPWNYIGRAVTSSGLMLLKSI